MARYLSQRWFDEVNEAGRSSQALRESTAGVSLTLQQVVTGTPGGDVRYWLRVCDGSVEAGLGTASGPEAEAPPDATVTQSYETATAISRGQLSTEEAFLDGRVRVRGDMGVLLRHQGVLHDLGSAFAEVHRRTEYP